MHEGPDVDEVPRLIGELVEDLNGPHPDQDRIITAAMAHLNLVMIHPFRDGNGRMARCVQSLVLARDGVLSPVFMSVEEYLGRNTRSYYDVLAEVGGGSWRPERAARPWVRYMLTAHLRQARTMLRRINESERVWSADATASRDLRQLVDADLLEPRGQKRGRFYVARPGLTQIRAAITSSRDERDDTDPFAG